VSKLDQRGQQVGTQYNADTIITGIPFETYKADLADKEKEIRQLLVDAALSKRDRAALEKQLVDVEALRLDERASYEAHIKDLEERIKRLDHLTGQVPEKLIDEAKEALAHDDTAKADQLFRQVEEQADPHIIAAAEAAYQRGKLAEDAINYKAAFEHYQRAVQLAPDNGEYLSTAGLIAGTLANYAKAIEWGEQALASDLKTYGETHPTVAIRRNNLGLAWHDLGEYQKAIGYYEQALASDLKTYGEVHPAVARDRNNLGLAWYNLGEYQKAIGYYEQALASDLKTYGEVHSTVAIRCNNLGRAWCALGQYQKAIGYHEQAVTVSEKALGSDHPTTKKIANNLTLAKANR
jgi:tetratricopeptide (TPR) repeat protein